MYSSHLVESYESCCFLLFHFHLKVCTKHLPFQPEFVYFQFLNFSQYKTLLAGGFCFSVNCIKYVLQKMCNMYFIFSFLRRQQFLRVLLSRRNRMLATISELSLVVEALFFFKILFNLEFRFAQRLLEFSVRC